MTRKERTAARVSTNAANHASLREAVVSQTAALTELAMGATTARAGLAAKIAASRAEIDVGLNDVRSDCASFRSAIQAINERMDDMEAEGATATDLNELERDYIELGDTVSEHAKDIQELLSWVNKGGYDELGYDELRKDIQELRDAIDEDRPHKPLPDPARRSLMELTDDEIYLIERRRAAPLDAGLERA
jgi:chromosome segregation ATPase